MNNVLFDSVRARLARRIQAVRTAPISVFHAAFQRFWRSLHNDPVLAAILATFASCTDCATKAEEVIRSRVPVLGADEQEHVSLCYHVLTRCSASDDPDIEWTIGYVYGHSSNKQQCLLSFNSAILAPLCDCLDSALDERRIILGLLLRYKQRCEWFRRNSIYTLWRADPRRGEKHLALQVYEYLHDNGVNFTIESWSASGQADIVASRGVTDPLVADAKIFNPTRSQGIQYLAKGVAQVYRYTLDYNVPFGCLLVFICSKTFLSCALSSEVGSIPYLRYNNKTLFVIVVDIFPRREPASATCPVRTLQLTEQTAIAAIVAQDHKGAT